MVDIAKFPRGVPKRNARSNVAPFATWADPDYIGTHAHWAYAPGKVFLGSLGGKPIGVRDDRHMMTVAGSRAGKGISTIIPNLLEYPGSVLVIDPKGENARITANRRGKGSKAVAQGLADAGSAVYLVAGGGGNSRNSAQQSQPGVTDERRWKRPNRREQRRSDHRVFAEEHLKMVDAGRRAEPGQVHLRTEDRQRGSRNRRLLRGRDRSSDG